MSAKYQFVSIKQTIAKTYRDYNIRSDSFQDDMIEWGAEALYKIGVAPSLVDQDIILRIKNNTVKLPFNFEMINVIYIGQEDFNKDTSKENYREVMRYAGNDFASSRQYHHQYSPSLKSASPHYYKVDGGYIKTSIDDRFILLLYKAFPLDSEGFPIIPDNPRVHEAISQHMIFKMMTRGWKHPAGLNFYQQKNEWEEACSRARADLYMPDVEDYRRFEQNWVKLIPGDFNNPIEKASTQNMFHVPNTV
jgi:hypothetical protein